MFKYFNRRGKRGQSTLEYAILIIIIIGALLSIQVYIKRAVQGRLKSASDDIGDQFSPGNTNVTKTRATDSYTAETFSGGSSVQKLLNDEKSFDIMNASVINVQQEYWGN